MTNQRTINDKPQVVVVGGGFGGLRAVRRLANSEVHVTLVDKNNYHLFQPLLYQVATAGVSPTDVAYPLRSIFRKQKNFDFHLGEVSDINLLDQTVITDNGDIHYDYLVFAAGGQTNFFGIKSVAANAMGLKDLRDASRIRDHLLHRFERAAQENNQTIRQALLTFVVAGGGPTGVETAGAISELVRLVLTKDYPNQDFKQVRVILLEAEKRLLAAMPENLGIRTVNALQKKGIEVRFDAAVEDFDGQEVRLRSGEIILTQTLIWAAGIRASALVDGLNLPQAAQRRVRIAPTLQVKDFPEVYIIGDSAYLEDESGTVLPMVAPVAMQQGDLAAENILHDIRKEPLTHFQYKDPGTMATIGRNQAVAWLGKIQLYGFPAWLAWLVVHIYQLIGFRNRILVIINWAWDYFFYDRAVRLISPEEKQPLGDGQEKLQLK